MSSVTSFPLEAAERERWLEYEAQLTELAERQGCLFLCHYARRALDPKHLLERVRSHSSIIHAGEIAPNLYYIPSRDAVDTTPDSLGLNELLADVADRARIQRMRRQGDEETLPRERPLEVALASRAVPFAILAANATRVESSSISPGSM